MGLFVLVAVGPALQGLLPAGAMVPKDKIVAWSEGLGQIAFGMVAAFLVFFLPEVVSVGRSLREWEERLFYYQHTMTFNRCAAFKSFTGALAAVQSITPLANSKIKLWLAGACKAADSDSLTEQDAMRQLDAVAPGVQDLVISHPRWALLKEKTPTGSIATEWGELRDFLLATYCSKELRKRRLHLAGGLTWLVAVNLLFGTFTIAPDPFWNVQYRSFLVGRYPLPEDYIYPEFSLWITACVYMIAMFLFAVWFSLESHTVHLYKPERFDGREEGSSK
jgi:hypothetical protein